MARDAILIVDDNAANLKVARFALQDEFDIRVASDGEEALEVLRTFQPRLILLDIQLPGIDGLELARRLKSDPPTRHIVIVAVTAYAMKGDREKALSAGCDEYLAKPLDPIQLPIQVAGFLGRTATQSLQQRPPLDPGPDPRPGGQPAERVPILVVEDNPTTRKMFRVTLESAGYEVIEAQDARTAVDLTIRRRPALIIQDLILPDMDGLDLARALRNQLGDSAVPIVCVSGFLSRLDEARAMNEGFAQVLVKPVDPLQLLEVVNIQLAVSPSVPAVVGAGRRLLVVDDDPLQRKLVQVWFSGAGFEVLTASDGVTALDLARQERPSAIVSDVLMPGMDGFALCLEIRRDPALEAIPVVLSSSDYTEEADRTLATRVGASALVSKSEGPEQLTAALSNALTTRPPAPAETNEILTEEHARRAFWQLERQAQQNARLVQRSTLQEAQLAVLAGVAESLAKRRLMNGVLGDVLAACLDMAGISKGALFLFDAERLVLKHDIGFSPAEHPRLRSLFGCEQLLSEMARGGTVVLVPSSAVPAGAAQALIVQAGTTSLLLVPVTWASTTFGVMVLGARSADIAGADALAFARVLGAQMGQAIGLARAFENLSASEERFRSLVESVDEHVFTLDREQHVTGVFGRWLIRQERSPSEFIGKRFHEVVGGLDPAAHAAACARALAGETVVYEWMGPGDSEYFQTSVSPMRHAHGDVYGLVCVSHSTTEQKRLQAQLMASDRMASVGTLAAGVAHEINNPLAAIMANLEFAAMDAVELASEVGPSPRVSGLQETLRDARDATERVRQIVKDLKIFSRAEEERRHAVDVCAVMDSTLRMADNEVRHRARVVKRYGDVPSVEANESRLGQVFLNLIVNAAQAIPEGRADKNEIRVTTTTDAAGRAVVEVRDTGPGIPADILRKLFTPFFTTKPADVGTGLGLAICQRIVSGFRGEISVESQVGVGTAFKVALPAANGAVRDTQAAPRAVIPAARRGTVLVVDDDARIGSIVRRALAAEHDAVVFASAVQALETIANGRRFDVIVCDLMMPVMTGMEFYAELEKVAPDQAGRIVFLTGGAFTAAAREFLDRVPNARMEKPFHVTNLRALVNERIQ